ncbi:hypothetical protein EV182_001092 [Spiromyces aspiralis]|uniref:Uncharacterized protein n=1 Tax=Spiromyces aspiralis TaxID=68401 RepID=A0ACC1HX42_9FUNG|nr:hypothetical protein EV182_001092 [Spiromyces aspiralis]
MSYSADTMRSRKQASMAVAYDDAAVLNGDTSIGSGSTKFSGSPNLPESETAYTSSSAVGGEDEKVSNTAYAYEKKGLSWKLAQNTAAPLKGAAGASRFRITRQQWIVLGVITLIAAYVRLWRLSHPHNVVFDEVHFGKFAGKYINQTYFFDVHPPLAKMMFAWTGRLVGYDGVFDFKSIGLDYLAAHIPYVGMRTLPAFLGLALVPITYVTLAAFGQSPDACAFGAIIVTLETALITQSRLILLDASLIFFTGLTAMFWGLFFTESRTPFSRRWWVYLALTGVSMGNALSCKWVGLFLVASVGFWTIKDLWEKLGDLSIPARDFARHFLARALCLIAIPLVVYVFWFGIHFRTLHKSGDGNSFMSPEFQTTLSGVNLGGTPRDIYYGSRIRIRHDATNAGYLHSHASNYETGSKQQQVTLYGFRDDNNYWLITRTKEDEDKYANATDPEQFVPIKNGDIVRLKHYKTARRLHSHDVRPPITHNDYQNEVSGYGWEGFDGDSNDHWRVQILEGDSRVPESKEKLMAIYSKFRLIHVNQRCALFSNRKKLPKWAFEQTEVTCMKGAKYPKTLWRIETNVLDPKPEKVPLAYYRKPGLLAKVIEANKVMWRVNNGLTKSHPYESRPSAWPLLRRGIAFWGENTHQIYLLGNPIIWWLSSLSVVIFAAVLVFIVLRDQRGFHDRLGGIRERYLESTGWFCLSWLMHYFPFFIMGRQLFLHHYLPALWFAILALVSTLDLFTLRASRRVRQAVFGLVLLWAIRMYFQYGHLAYGTTWDRKGCERSKWFSTWDYDCKRAPIAGGAIKATTTTTFTDTTAAAADNVAVTAGQNSAEEGEQPQDGAALVKQAADLLKGENVDINHPPPAENIDPNQLEEELNRPAPKMDHEALQADPKKPHEHSAHNDLTDQQQKDHAGNTDGQADNAKPADEHKDHEEIVGKEGLQAPPTQGSTKDTAVKREVADKKEAEETSTIEEPKNGNDTSDKQQ